MVREIFSNIIFGKHFTAVEHRSINGKEVLQMLILRKKKDSFELTSSLQLTSIADLAKKLDKNQHIFLIINSDKVISKSLEQPIEADQILSRAFPNLKSDEFYSEYLITQKKAFISICRKEAVSHILDTYKKEGLTIVGLSLGTLSIQQLANQFKNQAISISNATIHFDKNTITEIENIEHATTEQNVNGLTLNSEYILPLSGIIQFFRRHTKTESNFSGLTSLLLNNFQQQRYFNLGLKISLATIFTLLLFSFIGFTYYSSHTESLAASLELNKAQKTTLLKLKEEVDNKQQVIQEFSLASSKASWYIDQIGQHTPPTISLTELQWQPVTKSIKKNEAILTDKNMILLKGESKHVEEFSKWLSTLEEADWVEEMIINDYGTAKNRQSVFEIQLSFSP